MQSKELRETKAVPEDDMAQFRVNLRGYCQAHHGDYNCANLIITLKRTVNELTTILDAYSDIGVRVTPGRINVLMTLNSRPDGRLPLSELGDYLVVTRANITHLIDGLVKDGLVRRIDHPEDRRMIYAELTERGKKFVDWFSPRHHEILKRIGAALTEDEKQTVVRHLDTLRASIRNAAPQQIEPFPG